jgi:hypothetical protein
MIKRSFIKKNVPSFAIIVFLAVFLIIHFTKPNFLYKPDGSLRSFGMGYRNKTIVPMWLVVIMLAILSYLVVNYYIILPRI